MSAALRVLSVTTLFPHPGKPGNFGGFVARQFEALAARGDIDLTVINPVPGFPRSPHESEPTPAGVAQFPVYRQRFLNIPRIGWRWSPALVARSVLPIARRLHRATPFDVVDTQFFYPDGPAAAAVADALGLPLSIKARGSDIHYWGALPLAKRRMLAAADRANGILAVSEGLRADMTVLGMNSEKIAVHYTGLDHALFHQRDKDTARTQLTELAIPTDGTLFASVGNLVPLKGHALIIEALAEVPDARLAIAGRGDELANLRALAARLGLADRVHLLGGLPSQQVAQLLSASDALVLPSAHEGLANVWIEALACGTPLVITDVGGAREVARSPVAGALVERTPGAIAEAMRAVQANPPSRASVAAEASRFSWETNAAQLAAHYRRLAGV